MSAAHLQMSHRIWIDNLAQRALGSRSSAPRQLIDILKATCQGLAGTQLKVASKSVVMCTHHPDAARVARTLRLAGYAIEPQCPAGFFGIDIGGGGRRARYPSQAFPKV
eukprot:2349393-Pyramimonas_sp.AAC.1